MIIIKRNRQSLEYVDAGVTTANNNRFRIRIETGASRKSTSLTNHINSGGGAGVEEGAISPPIIRVEGRGGAWRGMEGRGGAWRGMDGHGWWHGSRNSTNTCDRLQEALSFLSHNSQTLQLECF